jgi:glycosyltransferase involved in cell wall biosynthesis
MSCVIFSFEQLPIFRNQRVMKVLLVGNYVSDEQESMQRFANLLHNGLTQAGHEVRLLRPTPVFGRIKPAAQGLGKWLGYIDKFAIFPRALKVAAEWADVIHICDHSNAFYVKYLSTRPHTVTCHDLLAISSALKELPEHRTSWTGSQFQQIILDGLREARHVVCVSAATKAELIRLTGVPERKVSLIYNGLNYSYAPLLKSDIEISRREPETRQPFLLHVGGNQWYKNRLGVLKIFAHLQSIVSPKMKLIMVGKPWTYDMREFVSLNGLGDKVSELTNISNADLHVLYSKAFALLFPSLREGFGWPIVEAQACGCPVFTSDRAPMTEVGGDAAVYLDPADPSGAAAVIANSLDRIAQLRQAGLENVKRFSSEAMICSYSSIYQQLAA